MADYTSWKSIIDLNVTGRHLPRAKKRPNPKPLPDADTLVKLFLRDDDGTPGGKMEPDLRSTLLFASFAQWFTDSFLRTSHSFVLDANGAVKVDEKGAAVRKPGREILNESTHEIDLCQIYGLNAEMTAMLRCPENTGCLRFQMIDGEEFPEALLKRAPRPSDKKLLIKDHFIGLHKEHVLRHIFRGTKSKSRYETLFATGLEHSNSTVGNALLNTVFLRMHNLIAREISASESNWDSDRVFETSRNTMIVILLNIVISDYVRHISPLNLPLKFQGSVAEAEAWYRKNRIHIEFNILYRRHGLVPSEFSFLPDPKDSSDFRHNNEWLVQTGVSAVISAFSKERAGKMVLGNTPRYLAGVKADTVKLMRDAQLQSYNEYRKRFDLPDAKKFSDITTDPDLAERLSEMYHKDVDAVEWYIGLCAERHGRGMIMGDLMMNMVAHDAFPCLSMALYKYIHFPLTLM